MRKRAHLRKADGHLGLAVGSVVAAALIAGYAAARLDVSTSSLLGIALTSIAPGLVVVFVMQTLCVLFHRDQGSVLPLVSVVGAGVYSLLAVGCGVYVVDALADPRVSGKAWLGMTNALMSLAAGAAAVLLAVFAGAAREVGSVVEGPHGTDAR